MASSSSSMSSTISPFAPKSISRLTSKNNSKPPSEETLNYLSRSSFHLQCATPGSPTFTFSISGCDDEDKKTGDVLLISPAGATRWIGMAAHHWALERGLRVIVIDKPGVGGTERCHWKKRCDTVAQMHETLIKSLPIPQETLTFMAMSAGFVHLLHMLSTRPSLIPSGPLTLYLVCPWVPYTIGQTYFSLLPTFLVTNSHSILPVFGWSSGVYSKTRSFLGFPSKPSPNREKTIYHEHVSTETGKLMWNLPGEEDTQGMSEEYRMCVGSEVKNGGVASEEWMKSCIRKIVEHVGKEKGVTINVWWGAKDGLCPRKGQLWLNEAFHEAGCKVNGHVLEEVGHEEPMLFKTGAGEALEEISKKRPPGSDRE